MEGEESAYLCGQDCFLQLSLHCVHELLGDWVSYSAGFIESDCWFCFVSPLFFFLVLVCRVLFPPIHHPGECFVLFLFLFSLFMNNIIFSLPKKKKIKKTWRSVQTITCILMLEPLL